MPRTKKAGRGTTGNRRSFGRIEKRPSGFYRAAYTGPDGQLHRAPTTFIAKDDAAAWLSARRAEIEMDVWAPRRPPAVRCAAMPRRSAPTPKSGSETRKTRGRELRPTTRYHYQLLLRTYINPTFGDKRIDRITVEDVNDWYDHLAPGREAVRAQAYSLLRTILTTATTTRPHPLIPYNPAHIRGAGNTQRVHKVRPASLEELEIIVAELPDRYQLMALLGGLVRDALRRACRAPPRRHRLPRQPRQDPTRGGPRRRRVHRRPAQDRRRHPRRGDPTASPAAGPGPPRGVHRSRQRLTALPGRRRTATPTWRRRRSTRSSTRRARPRDARICAGTTSATPAPSSPPRPAPPWPS